MAPGALLHAVAYRGVPQGKNDFYPALSARGEAWKNKF
jgi:hypothetical protein